MTSISTNYNISENNPLNLFIAVVVVAFSAHVSGKVIASVFSNVPVEAAVIQLATVVFVSRAVTQLLTKLKFHPEVVSFSKDCFGPFMWATQATTLGNVTELFNRVVPI